MTAHRNVSNIAGSNTVSRATRRAAALSIFAVLLVGTTAAAQSFQLMFDFGVPAGRQPRGNLTLGPDGCFYGTAVAGGAANGTIFRRCSGLTTTIFTFNGATNGSYPQAGLTLASDDYLYGTTRSGGASNAGTIFKINPVTRQLTTLHVFSGGNGSQSIAELTEGPDGRMYGVTTMGGSAGRGVAFAIQKSGSGFTVLRTFTGANGRTPSGRLVLASDDFLYGTTTSGGSVEKGTIFRLSPTGALTTLVSFTGANGANPNAGLVQASDGYLYGTTSSGGANSLGTAFRITLGGALTVLESFSGSNGSYPYGELTSASDGLLYGTTMLGGNGSGVIYKMTRGGTVTVLRNLSTTDGTRPESALVQANGRFYGVTPNNGPSGAAGTLFEITSSGAFTRLHAFNGSPSTPHAPLLAHPDGTLYGVSSAGGSTGSGTVFKLIPGVGVQVLHEFYGPANGSGVYDGLTRGSDGSLYGTAPGGGASVAGTIFKITTGGTFSLLASASDNGNGVYPYGTIVQGKDGAYYGVMVGGGSGSSGTIFRTTSGGSVTREFSFNASTSGKTPYGRLEVGPDGLLYGTASAGGASLRGTLFSFDPAAGRFTLLVTFKDSNGATPFAGVILGSDGRLYGTTSNGGQYGYGTIFAYDLDDRRLTTLHSFNSANGAYPKAALIEASNGRLYGTTTSGGASGRGVVYSIGKTGGYSLIHSFNGSDGASPRGGLVQAADSYLYGATSSGGSTGSGVLYRIAPGGSVPTNLPPTVALTAPLPGAPFTGPADITLKATAADADGTVAEVAFYANGTLLGKDTSSPYSFAWDGAAAGNYSVTAVARDNDGATKTSLAWRSRSPGRPRGSMWHVRPTAQPRSPRRSLVPGMRRQR